MALLGQTFNAEQMPEGDNNFEPIPAGWYEASINEVSLNTTKAGTGQYLKIRYDIIGPSHQGRVVFQNLNIRNPNSKAEQIGLQQFGDLMRAIGLKQVTDTDQLVGGNLKIKVKIRPAADGYDASNDVGSYAAISGAKPPTPVANQFDVPSDSGATAPPWAK